MTRNTSPRLWMFGGLAAAITAAFATPLFKVVRTALGSEIQSYTLLVPVISAYLLRLSLSKQPRDLAPAERSRQVPGQARPTVLAGTALAAGGAILAAAAWHFQRSGSLGAFVLSIAVAGYLLLLGALAVFVFGWRALRAHAFPLCFTLCFIPLPEPVVQWLSIALQHASADAADILLRATGLPVFRERLAFKLPGLVIVVAEECSGIRSTLVLFLTSILAGHLFLQTMWRRVLFAAAVVPLGILRNAFRITTITWLTVKVDPGIIDSPLHHRGGPVFFLISLVPLGLLLWWFRKSELKRRTS